MELRPLSTAVLLLLLVAINRSTAQNEEQKTLLLIKQQWSNPSALSSWDPSINPAHCNWTGVTCSEDGLVTGITVRQQGISTPIPAALCQLNNLSVLDLYYNNIPGEFPTVLYSCSGLRQLDISDNWFVGALPDDIDRLSSKLTFLNLAGNNFSGDVPRSIGRFPELMHLFLDNNLFNGTYPAAALGNLRKLRTLTLAYNPFAPAPISPEFGNLTSLNTLWMTKIGAVGDLPESLSSLIELRSLDLAWNDLTGPLPEWIWTLKNLQNLFLFTNRFSGEISVPALKALGLVGLDLSMNSFSGAIPEAFGKLRNLTTLLLYYNNFSGSIPAGVGELPMLSDLRLFSNRLSGMIPAALGKYCPLSNFEINDNSLTGELPVYLCSNGMLNSVAAYNNKLSGTITASLANCPKLTNIMLYNNNFSGEFPAGIWSAANLTTVLIKNNAFTGSLPGKLPWNLTRLELGNNKFTGDIPKSAPLLQVLVASNNLISGSIPGNFSELLQLQKLSLDGNQISGTVPSDISTLQHLATLDLRNNRLSGTIPDSIGSLQRLNMLDLSQNHLSGPIPEQFNNLKLSFLNLSANDLSGEIPGSYQNGAFEQSFLANRGLCSVHPVKNLQSCGSDLMRPNKLSRTLFILLLLLGSVLFVGAIYITILILTEKRRRNLKGREVGKWDLTSFHRVDFTEDLIVNGLKEENIIGQGGSGVVYRICLGMDDSRDTVAVKKIWNSCKVDEGLEKLFLAEVEILGKIRHTNIVKLLCCISSLDSKLLVYEYMKNSSLDRWLHGRVRSGGSSPLDWPTRLVIAVDAARGLSYMHHDCLPPIMHRDIKSSNILLDPDFRAKIADFGLARVLVRAGEPESVSMIAGSFGYMAPECGYLSKIDEKVDVYSFGVVLLELTTGRKANDNNCEIGSLAMWAWQHVGEDGRLVDVEHALDEEIRDATNTEEIISVFKLGLMCTGNAPMSRPSMKEVLKALQSFAQQHIAHSRSPCEQDGRPLLLPKRGSRRKNLSDSVGYDEDKDDDNSINSFVVHVS